VCVVKMTRDVVRLAVHVRELICHLIPGLRDDNMQHYLMGQCSVLNDSFICMSASDFIVVLRSCCWCVANEEVGGQLVSVLYLIKHNCQALLQGCILLSRDNNTMHACKRKIRYAAKMTCRQGSANSCDDGLLRSAVYMV
jgi:hypothetical protein